MFAKTKCLMVTLNRTSRYVQYRSIRKSSQVKYSADCVSSNVQLKRRSIGNFSASSAEEPCGVDTETLKYHNEESVERKIDYANIEVTDKKIKLNEVVKKAEELLGCQFSKSQSSPIGVGLLNSDSDHQPYFNLLPDWFQSDTSVVDFSIPKLLESGHPVLRLKEIIDQDSEVHSLTALSNNIQWRALIIMLVAKSFGQPKSLALNEIKIAKAKQITLSEIAEMMHFSFSLHRTTVEISRQQSSDAAMEANESSLHLGNKVAVLFGDILLARTSKGLSSLKNAKVTELMSDAISDFSESEIIYLKQLNFFKPSVTETSSIFKELTDSGDPSSNFIEVPSFEMWKKRVNLDLASLIGRSCLCSTLLSQLDTSANELAFNIGRNIGLVMQAYTDLELFLSGENTRNPVFDPCTLPVICYLSSNSVDTIYKPSDISEIYRNVMTSPVAILNTQKALEHLKIETLSLISKLPRSTSAPKILEDFISTLS